MSVFFFFKKKVIVYIIFSMVLNLLTGQKRKCAMKQIKLKDINSIESVISHSICWGKQTNNKKK